AAAPAYAQPPAPPSASPEAQPAVAESPAPPSLLPAWLRDSLDPPGSQGQPAATFPQPAPRSDRPPAQMATIPAHPTSPIDERSRWRGSQSQPPRVEHGPAT